MSLIFPSGHPQVNKPYGLDLARRGNGGWIWNEMTIPSDAVVTTSDVFNMFGSNVLLGWVVTNWWVDMEQVDTGTTASVLSIRETATATISVGSPAVVTWNGHGLAANTPVVLNYSSAAVATGLTLGTVYYVLSPTANSFNLSATPGGAAINTTGTSTGIYAITSSASSNVLTQSVAFNIGILSSDGTAVSGTSGLRWESNNTVLGRSTTFARHNNQTSACLNMNGTGGMVGLQCSVLPATAAWANKRIRMGICLAPAMRREK